MGQARKATREGASAFFYSNNYGYRLVEKLGYGPRRVATTDVSFSRHHDGRECPLAIAATVRKPASNFVQPDRGGYPIHPFLVEHFVFPIASKCARREKRRSMRLKPHMPMPVKSLWPGVLDEAEQLYREVLAVIPRLVDSRHLLGVIAYQNGTHESCHQNDK